MRTPRPASVVVLALLGSAAALVGCRPAQPTQLTPPPPLVTVAHPAVTPVQNFYDYNGTIEAVETVEIRARVKGYLEKVKFREGDEVAAGTPLYEIDPREYESAVARSRSDIARAVADAASAAAQVQLAQAELNRIENLGASGTKSELDKAKATLAANKAAVDVANANKRSAEAALRTAELQLGYTDIKAPIAGRISRTLVTAGNLVGQNDATLLTTIVSQDPVYVYFDVPERDRSNFEGGQASRKLFVGVTNETAFPHEGAVDFGENRVDTGTGTLRVRGILPNTTASPGNARGLYPGLFARVRVPVGKEEPRPVIPEEALMTGQEGRFVYVVVREPNPTDESKQEFKVLKRTVKVGMTTWRSPPAEDKTAPRWQLTGGQPGKDGKTPPPGMVRALVAIDSGLTDKDVVVVNGWQKVRPGGPCTPDERTLTPPTTAGK